MSYQNAPGTTPLLAAQHHDDDDVHPQQSMEEDFELVQTSEGREPSASLLQQNRSQRLISVLLSPITDDHGKSSSVAMGMAILLVCGALIGLLSPKSSSLHGPIYPTISACTGYTYFLMWSVSFYPQVLSNYRRKTTVGLSVDFAGLNVLGFACYSAYNLSLFYSRAIQEQYKHRHHGEKPTVQSNDVAFCVHALLLSSVTLLQIGYYDGFGSLSPQRRPSKVIGSVIVGMMIIVVFYPIIAVWLFQWSNTLDYLYILSYLKISVTLIKYIPQVVLNFRRKSTAGWSIWQILLDFSGGVLSDAQLILDCWNIGDFSGITGNMAKFFLGSVSIVFDIIFMIQHYVLYPRHPRTYSGSSDSVPFLETDENEPILEDNALEERDVETLAE